MKSFKYLPAEMVLAILISLCFATVSIAQNTQKDFSKILPAKVLESFKKTFPTAVINNAGEEKEKGVTYYEVESVDGTVRRDIIFQADGKIVEIEEKISTGDLPVKVKDSLNSKYPRWEIAAAEKLTKDNKESFEVLLKKGKETKEVVLDKDGTVLKKESKSNDEDDEDNEKDQD